MNLVDHPLFFSSVTLSKGERECQGLGLVWLVKPQYLVTQLQNQIPSPKGVAFLVVLQSLVPKGVILDLSFSLSNTSRFLLT